MSEPKKSLGQHWLNDEVTLAEICKAADIVPGDFVLEIGPGPGTLTEQLLKLGAKVHAVELDKELVTKLRSKFAKQSQFTVEEADILDFDFTKLPSGYKVVANIPYYLTSNLLRLMCESSNPFSTGTLLMQREVAERVCAIPGQMSILSVSVQFYCDVSLGLVVLAELFTPPPKVDSQVLVLEFRQKPMFAGVDTTKFFRLVRAGFSEKRKKLRSSLSGGLGISKTEAENMLTSAGIDPNQRAQELSLDDWHKLYQQA